MGLPLLLVGCVDGAVVDREMASLEGRVRFGFGDLGPVQDEAASREAALPAGARRYRPGDRFIYASGSVFEVVDSEGLVVEWQDDRGRSITATANPAFPPFAVRTDSHVYRREIGGDPPQGIWPLAVLDDVAAQAYNIRRTATELATGEERLSRHRLECTAEPLTDIDSALGPAAVRPLACRFFAGRRLDQRSTRIWDIDPALGHWLRYREIDQRGEVRRAEVLEVIEPGPWLPASARGRIEERLDEALEHRPSGQALNWVDVRSGFSGLVMATATFATDEAFCRAFVVTIAAADGQATDYPGRRCRDATGWSGPGV